MAITYAANVFTVAGANFETDLKTVEAVMPAPRAVAGGYTVLKDEDGNILGIERSDGEVQA